MSNGHQLLRKRSSYAYSAPSFHFHFQLSSSLSYYSVFLVLLPPSVGYRRSTDVVAALPHSTASPDPLRSTSAKSLFPVHLTAPRLASGAGYPALCCT